MLKVDKGLKSFNFRNIVVFKFEYFYFRKFFKSLNFVNVVIPQVKICYVWTFVQIGDMGQFFLFK